MLTKLKTSAHVLDGVLSNSVHLILTSPPYYNVRNYHGEQGIDWPEVSYKNPFGGPDITVPAMTAELGNEPTPEAYLGHMVLCLRRWWDVLRDDGMLLVDLGDTYVTSGGGGIGRDSQLSPKRKKVMGKRPSRRNPPGFKVKDIYAMPQRLALVAWAEGWYLRQDIPWLKRNAMPGSYDRLITSHETILMLTKRPNYYNDPCAIKRQPVEYKRPGGKATYTANGSTTHGVGSDTLHQLSVDGRNCRTADVWFEGLEIMADELEAKAQELRLIARDGRESGFAFTDDQGEIGGFVVNTQAYPGEHYAAWPERLAKLFIKFGTSEAGCCPTCGKQWQRATNKTFHRQDDVSEKRGSFRSKLYEDNRWRGFPRGQIKTDTLGWQPDCKCPEHEPIPSTCLDPFSGSGTTGRVAVGLGRSCILADISEPYHELTNERTNNIQIKLPTIER